MAGEKQMMNQSIDFWDRIAERYSKQPIADEAAYQKKLRLTREYFLPGMEVLEIGCGTGSTAISHAAYVKHICAVDISSKMINIARCKAEVASVENVTFLRSSIEDLTLPNQSLDAVLGLSILHLLENKDEIITKIHKMLKPGGIFISSTACIADSMKFIKVIAPIGRFFGLMPMVKVFATRELVDALTDAGFEISYRWLPDKGRSVFIVAKKSE